MLSRTFFRPAYTAFQFIQAGRLTRQLTTTSEQALPSSQSPTNTIDLIQEISQLAQDNKTPETPAEAPKSNAESSKSSETDQVKQWPQRIKDVAETSRLPRSVQALYLRPLRRKAQHGLPVCDLQLRSYSVRNVEFFADFAIRAAYYLNLPVSGPVPLPRIVERWTVPRSNFVHKKSQENFERITLRRLIQIKDGHPETVQLWLAFLRRHAFYGVGMKANVFDFDDLDVGSGLDATADDVDKALEPYFSQFGQRYDAKQKKSIVEQINSERFTNPRSPMNEVRKVHYMSILPPTKMRPPPLKLRSELQVLPSIRYRPCPGRIQFHSRRRTVYTSATADASRNRVIFSGIQPTGIPHLGNYLGALREWVRLQNDADPMTKCIYSIVDLHALTVPQEATQLRQWRKESFAILLAIGLDPSRSMLFYQSDVSAHAELMWILSTVASMGYLSRMTQWKSKLQLPEDTDLENDNAKSKLRLGLFSYPVLQAADILVHRATHVPVGEDQKQHIEFTRYTANSFNHLFGNLFPSPEGLISPARRVMSLKDPIHKMSKSETDQKSRILLTDSEKDVQTKIKSALTDSEPGISYDPARRPGISNLIEILSHLEGPNGRSCEEIASELQSTSIKALKDRVAATINAHIQPIRDRYLEIVSRENGYLEDIAEQGAVKARQNANETMKAVRFTMGL
ncbi:tryptophanyl-tRNA synthetase, putative [Talaromyces stipitatus ATCC 10500]|uniref:Small ribosomal subunit protein uS10m n=1 Tax=Talaromyces stipitatus (strain ATCC 10500 / CBS 375.48 / QM 6759 / NRRL 1006) TaxID=441959 RepID=B8MTR8_TALSN|nr:tryptophan--tRNA ligase [Talaromyces stipitatus ATCC 10500]EED12553.1 tryptophanyl-tRNA synthetase, putative [Talaromyces stipitatus ATCC 10500]